MTEGHWSALVDTLCDLKGTYQREFVDIERSVEIARGYVKEMRFHLLLEELDEAVLNLAAREADILLASESETAHLDSPTVLALTFTAYALKFGEGEEQTVFIPNIQQEENCRRVGAFILIEKMRRMEVYTRLVLPTDPWDDETILICEGEDLKKKVAFLRFLGYTVEDP